MRCLEQRSPCWWNRSLLRMQNSIATLLDPVVAPWRLLSSRLSLATLRIVFCTLRGGLHRTVVKIESCQPLPTLRYHLLGI
jgi:hypothetical protein